MLISVTVVGQAPPGDIPKQIPIILNTDHMTEISPYQENNKFILGETMWVSETGRVYRVKMSLEEFKQKMGLASSLLKS